MIQIQRLSQLIHQKTTTFSPQHLFQIHAQLITTGFHLHPSPLLSLFQLYLSNPSTLTHATTIFYHIQLPNSLKWRLMIRKHASEPNPVQSFFFFREMLVQKNLTTPFHDPYIYASLIKACNKVSAVRQGKSVHCHLIRLSFDKHVNIVNSLIHLYSNSADLMRYACVLFDRIPHKTIVTVNCMISGYVKTGIFEKGLSLFMQSLRGCFGSSVKPNYVMVVILISGCVECGRLDVGNSLHSYCCKAGLDLNKEVCNVLIDFYAKLGSMNEAEGLFSDMPEKDLVSWNTMITGYAKKCDSRKAVSLFKEMRNGNIEVDRVSLISLISACSNSRDLDMGKVIHGYIKGSGIETTVTVGTALINMYSKCGVIDFARKVFDELPKQNIESWNSLIHGFVACGLSDEALRLFNLIQHRKLKVDEATMLGLILACRNSGELKDGIRVHSYIESCDHLTGSTVLCNALIDMYAKCGSMGRAKSVFDKMLRRDVISWTTIIMGHAINGEGKEALDAFRQMGDEEILPNSLTFIGVLSACNHAGLVDDGRKLYDIMHNVYHIEPKLEHCGCMVDMHARAGMLEEAHQFVKMMYVEPNAIIWRMLMNACRIHSHFDLGLSLVSGITELRTSCGPEDHVIVSNIFAETGKWDDVLRQRKLMLGHEASKVAGKSLISYITK